jgi:hypothetical protein
LRKSKSTSKETANGAGQGSASEPEFETVGFYKTATAEEDDEDQSDGSRSKLDLPYPGHLKPALLLSADARKERRNMLIDNHRTRAMMAMYYDKVDKTTTFSAASLLQRSRPHQETRWLRLQHCH